MSSGANVLPKGQCNITNIKSYIMSMIQITFATFELGTYTKGHGVHTLYFPSQKATYYMTCTYLVETLQITKAFSIRVLLLRVAKPSPSNTMTRPLPPSCILPPLGSSGHGVLTKAELPALELYGCSMLGSSPSANQKPEV